MVASLQMHTLIYYHFMENASNNTRLYLCSKIYFGFGMYVMEM